MISDRVKEFDIFTTVDYMLKTTPPGIMVSSSFNINAPSFEPSGPEQLISHMRFENGKITNLLPESQVCSKKNKKADVKTKQLDTTSSGSLFSSDTTGHTNSFYSDFDSNPLIDDRSTVTTVSCVSTGRVFGRPRRLSSSSASSYDSTQNEKDLSAKRLRKALMDIEIGLKEITRKELDITCESEHDPNVSTASSHTFMTVDANSIVGDDDKVGIDTDYLDLSSGIDVSSFDDITSAASPFSRF